MKSYKWLPTQLEALKAILEWEKDDEKALDATQQNELFANVPHKSIRMKIKSLRKPVKQVNATTATKTVATRKPRLVKTQAQPAKVLAKASFPRPSHPSNKVTIIGGQIKGAAFKLIGDIEISGNFTITVTSPTK